MYGITQKKHLADMTELLIWSPTRRMWLETHSVPESEVIDAQVIPYEEVKKIISSGNCTDPIEGK